MKKTAHIGLVALLCGALGLSGCYAPASSSSRVTGSGTTYEYESRDVRVPSGTTVRVALDEPLRTDRNQTGDAFFAHTTERIHVSGRTVFPAGSRVRGRLTHVEQPHRGAGRAEMTLDFFEITDDDGDVHSIDAYPIALVATGGGKDEEKIVGGAVIGGIIGALTSKKKAKGAATGAVVGGLAGGAVAVATKGPDLELPEGQRFEVELTQPIDVQIAQRSSR